MWPRLQPSEVRALMRLRSLSPKASVHRDPVSGYYRCEMPTGWPFYTGADKVTVEEAIASCVGACGGRGPKAKALADLDD